MSPSVTNILGYEVEEVLSKSIVDLLTPESLELVNRSFAEALEFEETVGKDGYEAPPLEVEIYHKNGSNLWVEVSRVFLRNEEDKPTGVLIIVRDITKRKEAEEALQRSERRHRELIENNPEGISIVDFNQVIIFANQAFARIFGYDIEELQGMDALELVSPKDRGKVRSRTDQRKQGLTSAYQVEIVRKDGEHRIVHISAVPWRNDEGDIAGSISVVTEVTERVRAETELAASHKDLELYASILRHELGNDLQIIMTQSEAAATLLPPNSIGIKICETTQYAAERMKKLLDIFGSPEVLVTDDILSLLDIRARNAEKIYTGLKIRIAHEGDTEMLKVSRGRLIPTLFDNLFRNCSQHAGPHVEVNINVLRVENFIQIDIVDNGPGIADEIRPKLFQRGISTTGGGQGLYLCKRIAQAYGGDIELLSKVSPFTGAAFRIKLPGA